MSVLPLPEFFDWLDTALKDKGWSDYRLSKKAGLSNSFMPNLRKGARLGYESCAKIADALGVPRQAVYVKAGLDRGPIDFSAERNEWLNLFEQLSDNDQEELLALAKVKAKRGKREKSK